MPSFSLVLAALAGVAFAFLGLAYKRAAARQCDPTGFAIAFLLTATIITGAWSLFGTTPWNNGRLWLLGAAAGGFCTRG